MLVMKIRKLIYRVLLNLLIIYSLLCLSLYLYQRQMLYHPQSYDVQTIEDEIIINSHGFKLHGYVLNPDATNAMIYFGGNAEMAAENIMVYKDLVPGLSIYLVDYRGYGLSEGSPSEKALLDDGLAIYDHIINKHEDVYLLGRSLGSGVATFVAANRQIDKLILVTPYDSIKNIAAERYSIFPIPLLIKDPFESWKYAEDVNAETIILKAESDHIVPHQFTDALLPHFPDVNLPVYTIAATNHINIAESEEYLSILRSFLSSKNKSN
jgi:alpha/beta superfamily hydrolase